MLRSKERQVLLQLFLAVWLIAQSLVGLAKQDSAQESANSTSAWVTSNPPYQAVTAKKVTYGVCEFLHVNNDIEMGDTRGGAHQFSPWQLALNILPKGYYTEIDAKAGAASDKNYIVDDWLDSLNIELLNNPQHGVMAKVPNPNKLGEFYIDRYLPNKNYIGKDRIDFLVKGKDLDGKPFELTVKYYINVMSDDKLKNAIKNDKTYQQAIKKYCEHSQGQWRISESQAK